LQPHGMLGRTNGARGLIDKLWVKRILERADGVFTYHRQDSYEVERITPRVRTLELPNGIDVSPTGERWTPGSLAEPVVLFLARLHPRKRILAFVEMARILRDRGVPARYRVVGDGEEMEKARDMVRAYELEDRLTFVGSLPNEALAEEYLNCAAYVLPSVNEPFPMSVLEALSFGVPTVVTDTCFIAPMLESNDAALVSAPEPKMLASCVERVLGEPGLAERLSVAGMRLIEEKLTTERIAQRLEDYYAGARARTH